MAAKYSYKVWEHVAHQANPILEKTLDFVYAVGAVASQTLVFYSFGSQKRWHRPD